MNTRIAPCRPQLGQRIIVRGLVCVIVAIRPAGTIDVVAANGRAFRVSGLWWRED